MPTRVGSASPAPPQLTVFRVRYDVATDANLPWVIDTGDGTPETRYTQVIVQLLGKAPQVLLAGTPPIGPTWWKGSGVSSANINSAGKVYGIIADALPAAAASAPPATKK